MFTFPLTYCYPGSKLLDRDAEMFLFYHSGAACSIDAQMKKTRGFMKMLNIVKKKLHSRKMSRVLENYNTAWVEKRWTKMVCVWPRRGSKYLHASMLSTHTVVSLQVQLLIEKDKEVPEQSHKAFWSLEISKSKSIQTCKSRGRKTNSTFRKFLKKRHVQMQRDHLHLNTSNVLYADTSWHTQMCNIVRLV